MCHDDALAERSMVYTWLDCEAVLVFKSFCAKNILGCWCGEARLLSKTGSNELPPTILTAFPSSVLFY